MHTCTFIFYMGHGGVNVKLDVFMGIYLKEKLMFHIAFVIDLLQFSFVLAIHMLGYK